MTEPLVMRMQDVDPGDRRKVFLNYAQDVLKVGKAHMDFLTHIINSDVDDKFFEAPASSSGKYHPASSLGVGGLVRHTIVMTNIALDLLPMYELGEGRDPKKYGENRDSVILACLLHDAWKSVDETTGEWGGHSNVSSHGRIGADHIIAMAVIMRDSDCLSVEPMVVSKVAGYMNKHMTKWSEQSYPYMTLKSAEARVVAMADYIASRKTIAYNFEGLN